MRHKLKGGFALLVAVLALGALVASSALAAGKPTAETTPATGIFGTEATLNGTVEPNKAATKYYFEYGTTTSYGSKTAEATTIAKISVSKAIEGLAISTTYHFRLVATNSFGTSDGADQMFTTATTAKPEFTPGAGAKLPMLYLDSFGEGAWRAGSGLQWNCSSGGMSGEITGAKSTIRSTVTFTGCRGQALACRSEGSENAEEIKTQTLKGTLVYISKAEKKVGILFEPASGTTIAKLICSDGAAGGVKGSILMRIAPINVLAESFTLEAAPEIASYETEAGLKRKAEMKSIWGEGLEEVATWQLKSTFLTQHAIEIKA
jgi:hypothetical protein